MAGHFIFVPDGAYRMTVRDIQMVIEGWAPKEIAWERDNVGLQVGSPDATVRTIFVCLDVTEDTVREAVGRKADLVICHHPLLFRPLRSVLSGEHTGRCLELLLKHHINLYAAHTNLDFGADGTSFALAERLGLTRLDFLLKNFRLQRKIVTFVPAPASGQVAQAMADAGAGRIGNYEMCSFQAIGTGTFMGNERSSPTIGKKGVLEHTDEVRLEMVADEPDVQGIVQAMLRSHPYEEVAYDVYPLENPSPRCGMGVIGELPRPLSPESFTRQLMKRLNLRVIRATQSRPRRISKVAVCGGSGSDLIGEAIGRGAHAFVTADVKYHSFHEANDRILLIDAGHYETEWPVVLSLARRLKKEFSNKRVRPAVYTARTSSNPIVYNY